MRARLRLWTVLTGIVVIIGLIASGSAQALLNQLRGKPAECDSCDRAGWLDPSAGPAIAGLKVHGNPRGRLIARDNLYPSSGLLPDGALIGLSGGATRGNGGGGGNNGGGGNSGSNVFVNDPCLDPAPTAPFPENFLRTVQSETEIAVLNAVGGDDDDDDDDDDWDDDDDDDNDWDRRRHGADDGDDNRSRGNHGNDDRDDDGDGSGKLMVAGYNDSYGFDNNMQGLSGFSYSTDGGKQWIDGGGLPPLVQSGAPAGTPGSDAYFGDPVVVVHHRTKRFYYASIYQNAAGFFTLSVNRGKFKVAPQQVPVESKANTRCANNPALHGVPDPPAYVRKRIIWDPPVEVVPPPFLNGGLDFLDKEWLYVDQKTGFLYVTYTRFGADGSTPLELVRSFDGGQTWTPPSVIIPNLLDTFNQATQAVVTPNGRVIVSWHARTFPAPAFVEREQRIEAAFSDDGGNTFGPPVIVTRVDPQGEPIGYNRARPSILNAPFITVNKGRDDGIDTKDERKKDGFGDVHITYFDGLTPLAQAPDPPTTVFARAGDIYLSTSKNNGTTYGMRVKVNDDPGDTSHVFSSVQVNQGGEVFVTWLDRRLDRPRNLLTDTWGDISDNRGRSFGRDGRITNVSTDWITREDARPDFGDYNSSEVINFTDFVSIWADGRFPRPAPITSTTPPFSRLASEAATPDSIFAFFKRARSHDDDD